MSTLKIVCPDCGTTLVSAAAMHEGKLVDCPNCRLLFAVTAADVRVYDATARSTGTHSSEVEIGAYQGSIAPPRFWEKKRRRLKRSTAELLTIYFGGAVLLLIAAVVVTTYALQLRDGTGPPGEPAHRPAVVSHPPPPSPAEPRAAANSETPAAAPKADAAPTPATWRDRLTGVWESAAGPRPGLDGTGPVRWEFLSDGSLLTSARDGDGPLASRWQVQAEAGETAKLRVTPPRGADDGGGGALYRVTWLGAGHFLLTSLSEPDVTEAEFRRGR